MYNFSYIDFISFFCILRRNPNLWNRFFGNVDGLLFFRAVCFRLLTFLSFVRFENYLLNCLQFPGLGLQIITEQFWFIYKRLFLRMTVFLVQLQSVLIPRPKVMYSVLMRIIQLSELFGENFDGKILEL
jgi:hypothetical protein